MQKQLVIINGTGGSGKDTFVELASKYSKVFNFSSIDKVKEIARLIGWSGKKEEKDRKFLSDLKRLTTEYNDMSFHSVVDAIASFQESDKEIMFIHIREPEEIKKVVSKFHVTTLLIKRESLENITTNYSDASVDDYDYDFTIWNTTLEDFEKQAANFVRQLKTPEPKKTLTKK